MDDTTAAGLLLGVALLLISGVITSITIWLAYKIYKFFGGK